MEDDTHYDGDDNKLLKMIMIMIRSSPRISSVCGRPAHACGRLYIANHSMLIRRGSRGIGGTCPLGL